MGEKLGLGRGRDGDLGAGDWGTWRLGERKWGHGDSGTWGLNEGNEYRYDEVNADFYLLNLMNESWDLETRRHGELKGTSSPFGS